MSNRPRFGHRGLAMTAAFLFTVCVAAEDAKLKLTDTGYVPHKGRKKGAPALVYRDVIFETGKASHTLRLSGAGVGMPRPTMANFYGSRFFGVNVGKEAYFSGARFVKREDFKEVVKAEVVKGDASAELVATQTGKNAKVEVRIKAAAGGESLQMTVSAEHLGKEQAVAVSIYTYPSAFVRRGGHKVATYSSGRVLEMKHGEKLQGDRKAKPGERWVYMADVSPTTKKRKGAGGCAVQWNPAEVRAYRVKMSSYALRPIFVLKPGSKATFTLWDLSGRSNEDGLKLLKSLTAEPGGGKAEG